MKDSQRIQEAAEHVYRQVVKQSGIPEATVNSMGITLDRIHTAMQQCIQAGLTLKEAEENILKMWSYSNV